jgi:hypothetical protein
MVDIQKYQVIGLFPMLVLQLKPVTILLGLGLEEPVTII